MPSGEERIAEAVQGAATEGRISCKAALAIAERLAVSPAAVGRAINAAGIKIIDCQLGCFGRRRTQSRREGG